MSRDLHIKLSVIPRRKVVGASVSMESRNHLLVCVGLLVHLVKAVVLSVFEDVACKNSSGPYDDFPSSNDEVQAELTLEHGHALPYSLVVYRDSSVKTLVLTFCLCACISVYFLPTFQDVGKKRFVSGYVFGSLYGSVIRVGVPTTAGGIENPIVLFCKPIVLAPPVGTCLQAVGEVVHILGVETEIGKRGVMYLVVRQHPVVKLCVGELVGEGVELHAVIGEAFPISPP